MAWHYLYIFIGRADGAAGSSTYHHRHREIGAHVRGLMAASTPSWPISSLPSNCVPGQKRVNDCVPVLRREARNGADNQRVRASRARRS